MTWRVEPGLRNHGSTLARALVLALALGACGEAEDPNDSVFQPGPGTTITGDAQTGATTTDAGIAPSDAGPARPDTGAQITPAGPDAQTPLDANVTRDAQTGSDATAPADTGTTADTSVGDGSTSGDGSTGGDGSTPRMDLGKGDGKDVIAIGDSWMLLLGTGIQVSLKKAAMQPYRTYGVPGTTVLSGQIPGQFDSAKREDSDIKTVVMTGGGNDILLNPSVNDCPSGGPKCTEQLDKIAKALDALWKKMSESGVQDVVHVMYSEAAVKSNPVKNLAAHNERLQQMCDSHPPMRCFQLNTDTLAVRLRLDGIHPTDAEYDAIGKAAFDLMVKEGMRR